MMQKIIDAIVPHSIGMLLMITGWYISIMNVRINWIIFSSGTGFGLLMIIAGAYLPWIWTGIRNKFRKD